MESFLINEYQTLEQLVEWVRKNGVEHVAYRLWDGEFYGEYEQEEIEEELERIIK